MVAPRGRPPLPPPPPRRYRGKHDLDTILAKMVEDEGREWGTPFDPEIPPTPYARPHHFAVNNPEGDSLFDLDASGVALPGSVVRALGEYAQGDGAARALYVKATDLKLASAQEILRASAELQEQNQELDSGALDRLVSDLQRLARGDYDEPDEPAADERVAFVLTEPEIASLSYIAERYESALALLDAHDAETGTVSRADAVAAFLATEEDGGDLGTVPLAGGTLEKKIRDLWDDIDAWELATGAD